MPKKVECIRLPFHMRITAKSRFDNVVEDKNTGKTIRVVDCRWPNKSDGSKQTREQALQAYKAAGIDAYLAYKYSLEDPTEAEELMENYQDLCAWCGHIQEQVEPDAHGYICEECKAPKVNGPLDYLTGVLSGARE